MTTLMKNIISFFTIIFLLSFNAVSVMAQGSEKQSTVGPAATQEAQDLQRLQAQEGAPDAQKAPADSRSSALESELASPLQADDSWIGPQGTFIFHGERGTGRFRWPRNSGTWYSRILTYVDDLPVGSMRGWTYRPTEYPRVYFFFARYPGGSCASNRFVVMYSYDNVNFRFYDCAR